jgi:hypothetical protein
MVEDFFKNNSGHKKQIKTEYYVHILYWLSFNMKLYINIYIYIYSKYVKYILFNS